MTQTLKSKGLINVRQGNDLSFTIFLFSNHNFMFQHMSTYYKYMYRDLLKKKHVKKNWMRIK